ncbi:MAG: bifunctional DNA-formamidopyrimidine glycosylase/DNA-(apurinic or apyrimidinic site) lyase [Gemmatimonadales bacterium]
MPELPEVETIARDIRPYVQGVRIQQAIVLMGDILRKVTRPAFERGVAGRRVAVVGRRAKHVVIELDNGWRVVIQPRMTGALLVDHVASSWKRGTGDPYDTIRFALDSGKLLRFRDVRRLGAVFLLDPAKWAKYTAALGPEPLEPGFTAERLHEILSSGKLAVKKAIMDQKRLAGVGNIYANEALWMAGIDPSRESRRISAEESVRLHAAIVDVLARSIGGRGTTVRDYRTGTGEPGNFQGSLAVYERAGEPCLRCGRRIAMTHAIDARSSYFCPGCQR